MTYREWWLLVTILVVATGLYGVTLPWRRTRRCVSRVRTTLIELLRTIGGVVASMRRRIARGRGSRPPGTWTRRSTDAPSETASPLSTSGYYCKTHGTVLLHEALSGGLCPYCDEPLVIVREW